MRLTDGLLQNTLNALTTHIALLNETGTIIAVNHAWNQFAIDNGLCPSQCGPGVRYEGACCGSDDPEKDGENVGTALATITSGEQDCFYSEYPCHSPVEKRWFSLQMTRFDNDGETIVLIAHNNITQRKLAELAVAESNRALEKLTVTDSLTGVFNRRAFDKRLFDDWHRHIRSKKQMAVAMIDIDCFKNFNDRYGHQAGDDAIKQVANTLSNSLRVPSDFCARYGGEEFVAILPESDLERAQDAMQRVLDGITSLEIAHETSLVSEYLSVSIGISALVPSDKLTPEQFVLQADQALYMAKSQGRNQIVTGSGANRLDLSKSNIMLLNDSLSESESPIRPQAAQ